MKSIKPNRTVCLVEDDALLRSIFTEILEMNNCQVFSAQNAEDALTLLSVTDAKIIISDMRLPAMSGLTFLEECKKNPKTADTSFLAVTADQAMGNMAKLKGAHDVLMKPFQLEKLQALIEKYIN